MAHQQINLPPETSVPLLCDVRAERTLGLQPTDAPTGPTGVYAPDPFSLDGGAAEPPVGCNEEEMQRLVEVMSRVADCDDAEQEVDAFVESVDIERKLRRRGVAGLTLYEWLLRIGDEVVDLRTVESKFGYDLRLSEGYQMNDDSKYKRVVDAAVERSLRDFFVDLDNTAASLPGLADGEQSSNLVLAEAMRAKNQTLCEISAALCNPDCTQQALLQTAIDLRSRLSRRAVMLRIEKVNVAIRGVNCLAKLCACSTNPEELRCFVQSHFFCLADVCHDPPECLNNQLRLRGLSLDVFASCIARPGASCTGASNMQPSLGRTLDMIECFFSSWQRRRNVAECCVSAVNMLRSDVQASPECERWHGTKLCFHAEAMATVSKLGLHSAFKLRGPTHTCSSTGLYARVTGDSGCALRVSRFAHLLVECVRAGVLQVGKLRASLLLPSVARWITDKRFRAAHLGYFTEFTDTQVEGAPLRTRTSAVSPPAPMLAKPSPPEYEVKIREELARDYHIVLAMARVVAAKAVRVSSVKDILTAKGGFHENSTPASVSSAACIVIQKCINLANEASNCGQMEYVKAVSGCRGGGYFRCDALGAKTLLAFLKNLAADMRNADDRFVERWHPSRTSRQRAKAAASAKALEGAAAKRKPDVAPRMIKARKDKRN